MTDEPMNQTEILMTRLVDREASGAERDRFERLADDDRSLWRDLALRQLDMGLLGDRVAQQTSEADKVELPAPPRRWVNLGVTLSGWAAVIVLGLVWALATPGDRVEPGDSVRQVTGSPPDESASDPMTPEEHFLRYLQRDGVVGEWSPVLLVTEELPDGRVRLRYVRRIEEYLDIDDPLVDYEKLIEGLKLDDEKEQ
ncbi:MAG: hypothetical protein ACYS0D_04300 [Planctomycetota bacterium]|jgi:hypothetical protein